MSVLNVPKCDGTCSLPTPGRWVVNVVAKLWEAWELNNEKGAKGVLSSGFCALGKSLLFTQTCDLPLLLCPWPKTVFTLVFTPTSVQKRRGTKETLPLLLALANRGDA